MLKESTKSERIKLGNKLFHVVPLVLDRESSEPQKKKNAKEQSANKDSKKSMLQIDDYEDSGWINDNNEVRCNQEVESSEEDDYEPATNTKSSEKKQIQFTHFFSIPLNFPEFMQQAQRFHLEVSRNFNNEFKDFTQPIEKMHITLLMLNLSDPERVKKLESLNVDIQKLITDAIGKTPLSLKIGGIDLFEKNKVALKEKLTRVIYATLLENSTLNIIRDILNKLVKLLISNQVITEDELHNVKYNRVSKKFEMEKPHITLYIIYDDMLRNDNLRKVYMKFKRFTWTNVTPKRIDISTRFEYDKTGFYQAFKSYDIERDQDNS